MINSTRKNSGLIRLKESIIFLSNGVWYKQVVIVEPKPAVKIKKLTDQEFVDAVLKYI